MNKDRRDERTVELAVRKPYVKPAFRSERVFETMALSCGKKDDDQYNCHVVIKKS